MRHDDAALCASSPQKTVVVGSSGVSIVVRRFHFNGTRDTSFGGTGTVITTDPDLSFQATSVVCLADGSVIVGGAAIEIGNPERRFMVARYNANGTLDQRFGSGGIRITDFPGSIQEFVIGVHTDTHHIVAAGPVFPPTPTPLIGHVALARYHLSTGQLHRSFDRDGLAVSDHDFGDTFPGAITFDRSLGGYTVGGYFRHPMTDVPLAFALRYTSAGVPDTSFGQDGLFIPPRFGLPMQRMVDIEGIAPTGYVMVGYVGE